MSRRFKKRRAMAEMNVVPYIDVMLVLLVIFMVTAPMMQSGVNVNMPDADAAMLESDSKQPPLYISIRENGEISLGESDEVISTTELTEQMKGQLGETGTRPVYIRADGNAIHTYVTRAMIAAQKAGAKKISWMTDPESNN
ncbi:protein TolR [Cocleimonas flava]|jgi:biopolymer transport protein TolR|uniref:Cell division and transport-associated protein TolR n=1 Tax=Cocleimonas flava TaxID=634765 RepID=A0A4R1FAG5_9GAMM|nr:MULTISPECIES: ExbD/TolR family protein [Cocleimonas]MEB8431230.1 ExbD/TolR family protein [Cocleimonas sp. KMM 6892]MEC4713998.1 ExbD/TolR family protein [Cocleimonas sp. KMM 6895]MEC4743329.1 ExbD/TolR family protein [Cocleimonas sp. KMM 6896]TCJ88908.1 cell division and transport-associated protein TolR [Cocleimonas flava]